MSTNFQAPGSNAFLYLAYTTTSSPDDTASNWLRYSTPMCSGNVADEPILGYGNSWIAVDTLCFDISANEIADDVTLIPRLNVPGQQFTPVHDSVALSGHYAWRPSRDVSASGYSNLYLAASVVPTTGSPFVQVATIDPLNAISGPTSLPAFGDPGSYQLASPQCTSSSGCNIDLGSAEIKQVVLQQNSGGASHYLMTSFSENATSLNPPRGESIWNILQIESNTVQSISLFGNVGEESSFATLSGDMDQDIYLTSTNFNLTSGASPYGVWDYIRNGAFAGQDVLQRSSGNYTGTQSCQGTTVQRWGDYTSTLWDPGVTSTPSGEKGAFWAVHEYTLGGADQSTEWIELSDPLPYFVGSTNGEGECPGGPGTTCSITINAPVGVQNGDIILVDLLFGEPASGGPTLPDSSWTLLSASNISGSPTQIAASNSSYTITSWLAAHIFGSVPNDSGSYKFKHHDNGYGELGAFMVVYRGAGQSLSSYTGYGFEQNGFKDDLTTASITPPGDSQLVAMIFDAASCELPESTEPNGTTFSAPSGGPTLSPETALIPAPISVFAADASVPLSSQSYGPYTFTATVKGSCPNKTGSWLGWGVAIPEL